MPEDGSEWKDLAMRVAYLASLDLGLVAPGMARRGYASGPPVASEAYAAADARLGVSIARWVRGYHEAFGDGGPGPRGWIAPMDAFVPYRADEPYPGIEGLQRIAEETDDDPGSAVDASGYFQLDDEDIPGLVEVGGLPDVGRLAVVTTSPPELLGRCVSIDIDGYVADLGGDLLAVCTRWVEDEIAVFERVRATAHAGADLDAIDAVVPSERGRPRGLERLASLLGVTLPSQHVRVDHGFASSTTLSSARDAYVREAVRLALGRS